MKSPSSNAPSGTQAVQRALQLMQDVSASGAEGRTLTELAAGRGLARPTVHRLLAALHFEGMIERCESGRYRSVWRPDGGQEPGGSQPRRSPFHPRLEASCQSHDWRDWSGTISPSSYEPTPELEYTAIRNSAALIDVSPLYKVDFRGPDAEAATNRIFTRDTRKCADLQVMYTCWCDDDGKLLQDGNLVRLAPNHFRVTTADPSLAWFEDACLGFDVEVEDVTDRWAAVSVQGPRSCEVLRSAMPAAGLESLRFFRGQETSIETARGSVDLLVTRTGFTGDLGYEIWMPSSHALAVWDALIAAGTPHGLRPAGLQALDQSRIEAGLVLIEVDFVNASLASLDTRKSSPMEAGLGWTVKRVPGNDFIGRGALDGESRRSQKWSLVGIEVAWDELERIYRTKGLRPQTVGHPPDRAPHPVYVNEDGRAVQVGQATSQFFSPLLKRQIGLATVRSEWSEVGTSLGLDFLVDTVLERARATVVPLPFYDPPHKRVTPVPRFA